MSQDLACIPTTPPAIQKGMYIFERKTSRLEQILWTLCSCVSSCMLHWTSDVHTGNGAQRLALDGGGGIREPPRRGRAGTALKAICRIYHSVQL
eukprot:612390-Pleurochrysis_carterae.AAC.2